MKLFENMKKLEQLGERLANNTQTLEDRKYLSECLTKLCCGHDAYRTFGIASSGSIRRTDYPKHRRLESAFRMIMAYLDENEYKLTIKNKTYISDKKLLLKQAIYTTAKKLSLNPSSLNTQWKDKKYKHLKTLYF